MAVKKRGPQQVRIIGGKWKGRKLQFSGNASLRPTLGRTRETLFNWLRPDIHGAHCLDAFAGCGELVHRTPASRSDLSDELPVQFDIAYGSCPASGFTG